MNSEAQGAQPETNTTGGRVIGCLLGLARNRCELASAEVISALKCVAKIACRGVILIVVAVIAWLSVLVWLALTLWPFVHIHAILVIAGLNSLAALKAYRTLRQNLQDDSLTLACTRRELMLDAESLMTSTTTEPS